MYVTSHKRGTDHEHLHVTVERGYRRGTWEVRYEPDRSRWRVRLPNGREETLGASEPWVGALGQELESLMCRIAQRAVIEAMSREASGETPAQGEAKRERAAA